MSTVPGRQNRRRLTAMAYAQGLGEGEPTYIEVPRYDQQSTGRVIMPETPVSTNAPTITPPPQNAPMPAAGPAHKISSTCGCTTCSAASNTVSAGVSG